MPKSSRFNRMRYMVVSDTFVAFVMSLTGVSLARRVTMVLVMFSFTLRPIVVPAMLWPSSFGASLKGQMVPLVPLVQGGIVYLESHVSICHMSTTKISPKTDTNAMADDSTPSTFYALVTGANR